MPKNRSLVVFLVLLATLVGLSWFFTGSFAPPSGDAALWFYGGLFTLLTAKFVTEYRFTKPNDVIVNCLTTFVALSTMTSPPNPTWWEALRWGALACGAAALLLAWDPGRDLRLSQGVVRSAMYRLVTRLGSAEVIFSLVFVLALISYLDLKQPDTKAFVVLWGATLLAANLDVGSIANAILVSRRTRGREIIGVTHSFLSPSIVYCRKLISGKIGPHQLVGFLQPGSNNPECFGLVIDERTSATETLVSIALLNTSVGDACLSDRSLVVRLEASEIESLEGMPGDAHPEDLVNIVGTVAAGTNISQLRFEVFGSPRITAGSLLAVTGADQPVFYQVFEGTIDEEATLKESTRAFVEGEAEQVGSWVADLAGFETHNWVAKERSLVRLVDDAVAPPVYELTPTQRGIGKIPSSLYPVNVDLDDLVLYHTGILGVTGSGKSFLAFEIVEQCAAQQIKVVCLDPTGDYQRYLLDAVIINGTAPLNAFLESPEHHIAILETSGAAKHPIEQTKIISKACLDWCAAKRTDEDVLHPKPKVMLVLEEAHLLIPEWNFNPQRNLQDIVSATSQIVLQARKFGLGFLIISQRTANVVKSILNQCNTIVSFQAFDETGFDFLRNYMGAFHVRSLPNLKPRHGILVGKASLSRRPLMVRFNDQVRKLRDAPAPAMPLPAPASE